MKKVTFQAGEELFTYYGYQKIDFPKDVPWYFEQKLALEREERKKIEDEKKRKKKMGKQKKEKKMGKAFNADNTC